MKRSYYDSLILYFETKIDRSEDFTEDDSLNFPEYSYSQLLTIFKQHYNLYVQSKERYQQNEIQKTISQYKSGSSLLSLARSCHLYPIEFVVAFLCVYLRQKKVSALRTMQNLSSLNDSRLEKEIDECIQNDTVNSIYYDSIRHAAGIEYEYKLQKELSDRKIPFKTEADMRDRGMAKTPDILLDVPLAIKTENGWTCIKWIDSKAMFGNPYWQTQHEEQLFSYVNRFGNEPETSYKEILFFDSFPKSYCSFHTGLCIEKD
ncbi:hypothetical protein WA158_001644 [Blastocystis sp. Blastoise]